METCTIPTCIGLGDANSTFLNRVTFGDTLRVGVPELTDARSAVLDLLKDELDFDGDLNRDAWREETVSRGSSSSSMLGSGNAGSVASGDRYLVSVAFGDDECCLSALPRRVVDPEALLLDVSALAL